MTENYSIKAQLDASGVRSGINDIKGDLSGLDAHASKVGSAIGNALKMGVLAGGAAIVAGLAGGTKAFGDYEQGVADLNKIMGGTEEVQKEVANGMRELSTQSGTAVTSLLNVGSSLSALGIGSKDVVQATKVVDQMGIALGLNNDEAASYLAGMNTLYGTSVDKWGNLASGINEVENATSATSAGMLNFANEFAPVAKLMGVTDMQALALGATFEALKVPPAEAATSIRSALSYAMNGPDMKMDDATKAQIQAGADQIKKQYKDAGKSAAEATAAAKEYADAQKIAWSAANPGNDRMNSWARLLGVDVKTLNNMLDKDLNGTLLKTGAELGKIESGTKRMDLTNTIFGTYGQKSIALLGDQTANYTENLNTLNQGFEANVSIGKEVETRNNTLYGSWNKVKTGLNDIGITVGEVTQGPLKSFMDWFVDARPMVGDFIKAFINGDWDTINDKFSGIKDNAIKAFKIIAGAAGVGLIAVGLAKIAPIALAAGRAFLTMAATAVVSFARMTAASVISGLSSVAVWAASTGRAFVAMAAMAVSSFLTTTSAVVSGYVAQAAAAISAQIAFVSTWASLVAPIAAVAAGLAIVSAGLAAIGYALDPGKFTTFNKIASDSFSGLKSVILDCWEALQAGDFSGIASRLKTAMQDAWNYAKEIDWKGLGSEIIIMVWDGAKAIIESTFKLGDWLYKTGTAWVSSGGPEKLGYDLSKALTTAITSALNSDFDIWDSIKSIFGVVGSWLSLGWEIAKGIGQGILKNMKEYLTPTQNQFVDFVKNVGDMFFGLGKTIGTAIDSGLVVVKASLESLLTQLGRTVPYFAQMMGSTGDTKLVTQSVPSLIGGPIGFGYGIPASGINDVISGGRTSSSTLSSQNTQTLTKPDRTHNSGGSPTSGSGSSSRSGSSSSSKSSGGSSSKPAPSVVDKFVTGLSNDIGTLSSDVNKVADSVSPEKIKSAYTSTIDPNFTFKFAQADNNLATTIDKAKASWDAQTESWKWKVEAEKTSSQTVASTLTTSAKTISTSGFDFKGFVDASKNEFMNGMTISAITVKDSGYNFKGFVDAAKDNFMMGVTTTTQTAASNHVQASGYAATALRLGAEIGAKFTTDGGNAVRLGGIDGRTAIIGGANQGAAIGINAANQNAAVGLNSANQQGGIGTNAANVAGNTTITAATTASSSLVSGAENAARQFATGVGSAVGGLAAVLGNLGSWFGGYGGGGSSGGSTVKASNINLNGADVNGNFKDMTCLGDTVLVNGLKYTDPKGNTTYINPLTFQETGGIANYQGSSGKSGGSSGYSLPPIFAAKGADIKAPTLAWLGERGEELVLPSDITAEIKGMIGDRKGGSQPTIINLYMSMQKVGQALISDIRQSGSMSVR